jgi:hypothetical protein
VAFLASSPAGSKLIPMAKEKKEIFRKARVNIAVAVNTAIE